MTEDLAKHGLYFDYLYNLRVLDPNIAGETSDLKEKSGEYTESKGDVGKTFTSETSPFDLFFPFFRESLARVARISKNHR